MATISENLIALQEAKESIKTAITNKGQDLTNVPFTEYGAKIDAITTGGGEDKFKKLINGEDFEIVESELTGITEIPNYFMYNKALTNIQIPNNITKLGDYAFALCKKLVSITIPDSVTSLGNYLFNNCSELTSVTIGTGVTSIGGYVFNNTNKIKDFYFYANKAKLSTSSIDYSTSRYHFINYHIKSLNDYLSNNFNGSNGVITYSTAGNKLYVDGVETKNLVVPAGFENLNGGYFYNFTQIESVKFEGNITNINRTFISCKSIMLYDFRNNTVVPTLNPASSVTHKSGCIFVIPDALYDEWIAATNWASVTNATFVKASEYVEG